MYTIKQNLFHLLDNFIIFKFSVQKNKLNNIMQQSRYIIKKQFTDLHKYDDLLHHTLTYEQLFKAWLGAIISLYKGFHKPKSSITLNGGSFLANQSENFDSLIFPFVHTLYNIENQHLNYISSQFRLSASVSFERDSTKLIQKIKKLKQVQLNFEGTYRDLLSSQNRINMSNGQNLQYYLFSNWFRRLNTLEKYSKSSSQILDSKPEKEKIFVMSEQVQNELLEYRKKIFNYKYGYLKEGVKLARQLLSCLSEYISIGIQMLTKINGRLKVQMSDSNSRLSLKSFSDRSSMQAFSQFPEINQSYEYKLENYRKTLSEIQSLFIFAQSSTDKKVLFSSLTELYPENDSLLQQMFDVYTLFQTLNTKRKSMYQKIGQILAILESESKNKNKVVDILSTLNKRKSSEEYKNDSARNSLEYKLDLKKVEKSITEAIQFSLKSFTEISQMCSKASQKNTDVVKNGDNMEVSYQYKEIKIKNKRPGKEQMWLWKDWRQFRVYQEVSPKYEKKHVEQELSFLKKLLSKQESEEKVSCAIQGRHSGKAILEIFSDKIQILKSEDKAFLLTLPYKNIDSIQSNKKKLLIHLNGGVQLKLSKFKDLGSVEQKLNEYILSKDDQQADTSKIKKPQIILSPEEIEAIQKRKNQINGLLPNISEFKKYAEAKISNSSIQQVFSVIFSDKSVCPLNKSVSFFQYFSLKGGNLNFKCTKFDKPGPYFYTEQDKQVTFINAALFSTRQSEIDHPLPPLPFIPKNIHCVCKDKIFWISNKQIVFIVDTYSQGHKMMQSFYTSNLYKIVEQGQIVKIQISCKIQFIKQTSIKSILIRGANGEIQKLVPELAREIQKCMKAAVKQRISKERFQNKQKDLVQEKEIQEEEPEHVSKVTKTEDSFKEKVLNNKHLVIFFFLTVLINLMIKFLF